MNTSQAVAALGALAQESRLAVFRLLVERGPDGHPAGVIGERLGIPRPTLSFHLRALVEAGLATTRREGRFIRYAASFDRIDALVDFLTENCCDSGSGCAPACALPGAAVAATRRPRNTRGRSA